jgi:hypothetical protein
MQKLSPGQVIEIADLSVSLAANYQAEGSLYGPRKATSAPQTIAIVADALRWNFDAFDDAESVAGVTNYLYWICGKFALEAQNMVYGPGGGVVVLPNPLPETPNPIEFEVSVASLIIPGSVVANITEYIGYNLLFVRNNVPQSIINVGGSYFSWNKSIGELTFSPAAEAGEVFQFYPFI